MKLSYAITGLVALIFAVLGWRFSLFYTTQSQPSDVLFATHLPAVSNRMGGSTQSLQAFRHKILLVNFWATWCAPCVQEMPALSALQTELSGKEIQIIGIGIDSQEAMSEFAQQYQITYPLFGAGMSGAKLAEQFGNKQGGLPFTVLLNNSGQIVKTYLGKLDMRQLRQDVLALKAE
jgi:thiol-disulfide isomerase/thioredoxin